MTPTSPDQTAAPVRFAILGFGHHATKRLVPAFAQSSETTLVGLWRRNSEQAASDAQACGIPHAFSSPEALCSSPEVDAVFITSPDALHRDDTLLALEHGKAVLCEKPLSMTTAEAEEMQTAASSAGLLLGVAQNMRWYHSLDWIRETILSGRLGTPQIARAQFCYQALETPRRWITDGSLACGGPIGDVGVHCLDALRFVLGQQISTLHTVALRDARFGPLEAAASLHGETDAGCLVDVSVSALAPYRTQIEIVGSEGIIVAENGLAVDLPITAELRQNGDLVDSATLSNSDSYIRMLDSFARSLRGQETFAASAADGILNMRLLDQAYAQIRPGRA